MQKKPSIFILGSTGKMGLAIKDSLNKDKFFSYHAGSSREKASNNFIEIDKCKVILDFSSQEANKKLLIYIKTNRIENKTILIGTTSLEESTLEMWKAISISNRLKCILAPNTSIGAYLLLKKSLLVAKTLTQHEFDIEIEETHHKYKKDLPSGTALYIANNLAKHLNYTVKFPRDCERKSKEIVINSTRAGGIFGEHKVRFISEEEEFTILHRAISRNLFAKGALIIAKKLFEQKEVGFFEINNFEY